MDASREIRRVACVCGSGGTDGGQATPDATTNSSSPPGPCTSPSPSERPRLVWCAGRHLARVRVRPGPSPRRSGPTPLLTCGARLAASTLISFPASWPLTETRNPRYMVQGDRRRRRLRPWFIGARTPVGLRFAGNHSMRPTVYGWACLVRMFLSRYKLDLVPVRTIVFVTGQRVC
jgi:hypothetical protein